MPADSDGLAPLPFDVPEADRDLMARVIYGEANTLSPRAQAAVGQVIVNRALADGYPGTIGGVVTQRGQFEPMATRRGELQNLSPDSKAYREARQTVEDVLSGRVPDMTGGATHFYAPKAQAAFGRRAPSWAQGDPLASEGGHVFYAPQGKVDRASIGLPAGLGPATWSTLEDAGVMPLDAGTTKPKAPAMPKEAAAADDDILALYGVKTISGKPGQKSVAAPSSTSTLPETAAPAGDLSDDALLGLYVTGAGKGAKTEAAPRNGTPAAMPLPTAEGVVDGNTGELVVGGKPFTDNKAGLWDGFSNFANGALLGAGVPIVSAAAALKEKALNGGDLGNLYQQARSVYGGATDQYRAENPKTAIATELAGSIPTTVAATMAGGAALGAGGNMLLDAVQGSRIANPLIAAGRFAAGTAGRSVPATAGVPVEAGNLLMRMASQGTAGAAAGAFGGAINTGLTGGDIGSNALQGAIVGGGIGGALPAAGAAIGGGVNKLTGSVAPEVARLARTAEGYGIPIRTGQMTDSPAVRFLDSTLSRTPGMGYGAANRTQQVAVNRAVANTFGETADRITPSVMEAARTRIGQAFDKVAAGSWVRADEQFAGNLDTIFKDASSVLTPPEMTPLRNLVRDGILPKFGTLGEIEGSQYQALTRKGAPLDRLMNSTNPNVKFYASQMRDALDGALERSAPAELVDELRQARSQWRSMKTIEDLAAKSATGDISPAGLMQAVQRNAGPRVAYQGGGDLGDLARIGQRFLKEPPSSGTAERIAAKDSLGNLAKAGQVVGGAAGAAVGLNHFAPQLAALAPGVAGPAIGGALASFAAGRLASSALRSPALSNRLIDRALGTGQAGPVNRLAEMAAMTAPETTAPLYNRAKAPAASANDNANRLTEFLAGRQARATGSLP